MTAPFVECAARLGWIRRFGELIFYPDAPSVTFSLTPVFPGCSDTLAKQGIVWNLWSLIDSIRRPGAYSILNCECGYPPDADIKERVCVSHPNDNTVVWELDFAGLAPACDEAFRHMDGFMRFTFDRAEYESDVRSMLREVQRTAREPVPFGDLVELRGHADLEKEYPGRRHAVADLFEPTIHGDCDSDEFLELDADAAWPREAIFPPGTVIEIGCFGTALYRIDGKRSHEWIGQWFTRWQALSAFRDWGMTRRFAARPQSGNLFGNSSSLVLLSGGSTSDRSCSSNTASDPNEFVLRPGQDADTAHDAGAAFADALRECLAEGNTAPGVEVRHVRSDIPLP